MILPENVETIRHFVAIKMAFNWSVLRHCVLGLMIQLCCYETSPVHNRTELKEFKQAIIDLSYRVETLNDTLQKDKKKNVMFYAVIRRKDLKYNVDANVVFETVIVNKGGHYDQFDGVFVAPVAGTYLFSWTVSGIGADYIVTELMVAGNTVSATGEYNGGSGGLPSGSMTALSTLKAGDHAWIRSTGVATTHRLYSQDNYPQSGFLGMLVISE